MTGPEAVARVRSTLEAAVPGWYGPGAVVATLAGPRAHDWSYQFDLEAGLPSGRRRLVVKIPRWEQAPTLEAALAAGPQEGTRREHATLVAQAAAVAASGDPGLAAVAPVAYLSAINAVVTERLDAAPLGSLLGRLPGGAGRRAALLRRAGRAVRLYHDRVAGAGPGRLDGEALAEEMSALAGRSAAVGEAAAGLAAEARERHDAPAVVGAAHGDCNLANLLVTPDGRVAVLDPNLVPGPLLADAAKLLTDLRMRRARSRWLGLLGRRGLAAAEAALLEGYGATDAALLGFLRRVAAVRRGAEMEEHFAGLPGLARRPARAVLRRYVSAELSRLGR